MFKKELKNSIEIAEFISEFATDYVDEDLILEYFFGCKAILKKVSTITIKIENSDNHIRNKKKEKIYENLPFETMPPLVVEKSVVLDGNHRLRVANKRKQKVIYIYDILPIKL